MCRACAPKARAEIVHADHKIAVGIDRFARANHVVPPALTVIDRMPVFIGMNTRYVMRSVEGMTNQNGIAAVCVQLTVGFVDQLVSWQHTT